jgi:UDP-N-acetylmuramoylalanine--D-glutamate ligase
MAATVARLLSRRVGEVAVIGLASSGLSAARLLRHIGFDVYASDRTDNATTRAAADAVRALGAAADIGQHDIARIARAAFVVVSPGVPPEIPPLEAARAAGVPVVSEVEIALRLMPATRAIAVTGTNGKTTTTALIGHLLRALGHEASDAGNIGVPLCDIAIRESRPEWLALELSSYQLHDTPGLNPTVGVLTTLSADHLDRYPSVAAYYADKQRLFANAQPSSRWVVCADSPAIATMITGVVGSVSLFSVRAEADGWYNRTNDQLMVDGVAFMSRRDVPLLGDHNVANVLAAVLAVLRADASHNTPHARAHMAHAVAQFAALAHRLEPVALHNDVLWINDSKATNVDSTLVALQGMTRPTIHLLGGRHKGEPYSALAAPLAAHGKAVLCYGEAGEQAARELRKALGDRAEMVQDMRDATFDEVVRAARALATTGDAVLLSPACSSFDMFNNYAERGVRFAKLARMHA